jgi:predicted amidophosphoribosyltransferase
METEDSVLKDLFNAVSAANGRVAGHQAEIQQIKGVKICPNCGNEVPVASAFCGSCGATATAPPAGGGSAGGQGVFCVKCGSAVAAGIAFCQNCGQKV